MRMECAKHIQCISTLQLIWNSVKKGIKAGKGPNVSYILTPDSGMTEPKSRGVGHDTDPALLTAGRYGTDDTIRIFGDERTFEYILRVQATAIQVLSDLYPAVIPPEDARVLVDAANLEHINPSRIRELEAKGEHDIIAINNAWEEVVSPISRGAASHINKLRTSADTTESAKALQLKDGLHVIADSVENLRDITLERAVEWVEVPHMDQSHLYDAVPAVAGRTFVHYAEMLQSGLNFLRNTHDNSLFGKWADATGNYHSAVSMGLDGRRIEKEFCSRLGLRRMKAPAQVPGREYLMDVYYTIERIAETIGNLAHYIRMGRGDDTGIFSFPRGKKGSSAMPHKDAKGGNPIAEEQAESLANYTRGVMVTAMSSCRMDYARDLSGSASDRINLEDTFKFADHVIRKMANVTHKLILNEERSRERVTRSYGVVTSPQFLNYLTDPRRTGVPMPRSEASDLVARLATEAYDERRQFAEVLLEDEAITSRISEDEIREMADPLGYMAESSEIVRNVHSHLHGKRTLPTVSP